MGDRRYDVSYDALAASSDRPAALRNMSDEDVIHALAAASRKMDAYLANVLAVEVLRRRRRERARLWGAVAGLGSAVVARSVIFLASDPADLFVAGTFLVLLPCALGGYVVYRLLLHRPAER